MITLFRQVDGISMQWRTLVVLGALALIIGACGDNEAGQTNAEAIEDDVSMGQDVSPPPASNAGADTAPLTVADVERWERGMQAELEAVEEAERSFGQARTAEDTLNAMTAANETATLEAGARAAGVNVERYRFIRRNLSNAVKNLTPLEQEMDISQMPQDMIDQFEQGRQASLDQMSGTLPPEVLEALRPRATELRLQDGALTQARMRAAGLGR